MFYKALLIPFFLMLMISCSSDSGESQSTYSIEIPFTAVANDIEIKCGEKVSSLGMSESEVTLEDFRFYIHDVRLIDQQGVSHLVNLEQNKWQVENVALLDFQTNQDSCSGDQKETNKSVKGEINVDPNSIQSIEFTLGVPEELNHKNPSSAPSPLNVTSMFWAWQTGYKFMRIDVSPVAGITRPSDNSFQQTSFKFHLGSTGCEGNPELEEAVVCARKNRPIVSLEGFKLDDSHIVTIDYAKLIKNVSLVSDEGGAAGCMSGATDPECKKIFTSLGLALDSGKNSSDTQVAFEIKTK